MSCFPRSNFALIRPAQPKNCRLPVPIAFFCLLFLATPTRAADHSIPTPQAIDRLELRAGRAKPQQQPFLYTQLVHALAEQACAQYAAGNTQHAVATLSQIDRFIPLIHRNLAHSPKRLKSAEMLLHDASYRLGQLLHRVSGDDLAAVQLILNHVSQLDHELLIQVFNQ